MLSNNICWMAERLNFPPLEKFHLILLFVIQSAFGVIVLKTNVSVMLVTLVQLVKYILLLLVKIKLELVFKELLTGQLNIHLSTCKKKVVVGCIFLLKEHGLKQTLINLKLNLMLMDTQLICHQVFLLER